MQWPTDSTQSILLVLRLGLDFLLMIRLHKCQLEITWYEFRQQRIPKNDQGAGLQAIRSNLLIQLHNTVLKAINQLCWRINLS